ncbi:MAG: MarR family transcriptional regulator [Candidatus Abyssubacteria bacterium]
MSEEMVRILNDYLVQMAENLPLFEQFNFNNRTIKDLTLQELHAIGLIGRLGAPTMSELARRGRVTNGAMTSMVNKLVKKGYARRSRNNSDRRVVHVELTERGRRANRHHQKYHEQVNARIMAVLSESEQLQAIKLMRKILGALV